jgi:hypothetical protein
MKPPRYSLSFTVGGLFLFEGLAVARLRVAGASWEEIRRSAPDEIFVARGGSSSAKRIRNEIVGRVSQLSDAELAHLTGGGMTDARALMWIAACRKYRILADFTHEVLDERLRSYQPEIRPADFTQLLDAKAVLAEEVAALAPSTRQRLSSVAFRMLREAELLDAEGRVRLLPLSGPLRELLATSDRPGLDMIPGGG